jgi:hypothetical protein
MLTEVYECEYDGRQYFVKYLGSGEGGGSEDGHCTRAQAALHEL